MPTDLERPAYRDRVHGAWLGQCIGATLGAAVEGSTAIQRVSYYDPLPGQALARAELDIQLVALKALRRRGPELTADDLVHAWSDHVRYTWDEMGYAARNVARGLRPPMTGAFDNWFGESAGGLGRCTLWAQVAPCAPQAAAVLAYQDASHDHAGEGTWAAMLWAALASAAFVVSDVRQLLRIGLAMVPAGSRSARAVTTALDASVRGVSWVEARGSVIEAVGRPNITDAPTNLGFAAIGLLYGAGDYAGTLRSAVNCGYASGTTGGIVGALLGIMAGRRRTPAQWADPIGENVVLGWGAEGLDTDYTLTELTEHTVEVGEQVVAGLVDVVCLVDEVPAASATPPVETPAATPLPPAAPEAPLTPSVEPVEVVPPVDPEDLLPPAMPGEEPAPAETPGKAGPSNAAVAPEVVAPEVVDAAGTEPAPAAQPDPTPAPAAIIDWHANDAVKPLLVRPGNSEVLTGGAFEVDVDYGTEGPVLVPEAARTLALTIRNVASKPFTGRVTLGLPTGWLLGVPGAQGQRQVLAPGGFARYGFVVKAPAGVAVDVRNKLTLVLTPEKGRATTIDFTLFGAACWWFTGPLKNLAEGGFDQTYEPEGKPGLDHTYLGRDGGLVSWRKVAFAGTVMPIENDVMGGMPAVAYGQTTVRTERAAEVRLVAHCSDGVQVWLNDRSVIRRHAHEPFRPTPGAGPASADVVLPAGENRILLKVVRCSAPVDLAFMVADRQGRLLDGVLPTTW